MCDEILSKYKKSIPNNKRPSTSFIDYGWSEKKNLYEIITAGNPHLKPHYTWACQETHVTPKSHKLGLVYGIYGENYKFLMNSSNIGMTEPAQASCLNLW